jgi:hypothetical protein
MLHKGGERTDDKTTDHVDGKRAQWKSPRSGMMQDDSTKFVTADRTDEPTEPDDQSLFHRPC